MLQTILDAFKAPEPAPLTADDTALALAALLVRIAKADDHYDPVEAQQICDVLAELYDLAPAKADALRSEAETLEAQAPDMHRFTQTLKKTVAYEDRAALIRACWQVVMADGVRDQDENAQVRQIAQLLGVNDRDSNIARRSVT